MENCSRKDNRKKRKLSAENSISSNQITERGAEGTEIRETRRKAMLLFQCGKVFPKSQLKIQTNGCKEFTRVPVMGNVGKEKQ